ncbi:MAG: TPM domain-containing protein, partial [Pseudomonadota bacterium]
LPGIAGMGGSGMRMEDYGKELFNAWGVGEADRNDGIMLLLDTEAREARIALGAGYDPVYDGRAARVLSTAVLPPLRSGNFAEGIEAGVASARERLITPFLAGTPVTVTDGFETPDTEDPAKRLDDLLTRQEARIARVFRTAIASLKDELDLDELADLLALGR